MRWPVRGDGIREARARLAQMALEREKETAHMEGAYRLWRESFKDLVEDRDEKKHALRKMTERAEQAEAQLREAEARVRQWRGWAQYVYLGGGQVGDGAADRDLQALVCAKNDEQCEAARALLKELVEKLKAAVDWGTVDRVLAELDEALRR